MNQEPVITKSKTAQAVLTQLKNPFPTNLLKYRVGATTKDKKRGIPLFYITSRDIFARLDQIVGPENWKKETQIYRENGKTVYARTILSLRLNGEWINKDGIGSPSNSEPEKGAESDSVKRAAIAWGIGRYLYYLPNNQWFEINEYKQFTSDPRLSLPKWASEQEVEDWEKVAISEYEDDGGIDFEITAQDFATDEEKKLLRKSEEVRKAILERAKES